MSVELDGMGECLWVSQHWFYCICKCVFLWQVIWSGGRSVILCTQKFITLASFTIENLLRPKSSRKVGHFVSRDWLLGLRRPWSSCQLRIFVSLVWLLSSYGARGRFGNRDILLVPSTIGNLWCRQYSWRLIHISPAGLMSTYSTPGRVVKWRNSLTTVTCTSLVHVLECPPFT